MRRRSFLRAGAMTACTLGVLPRRGTAASESSFAPLGTLQVDGLAEVVVDPSGTIVYGAIRDGFVVVDVSDPEAPTELARVEEILPDVEAGPVTDIFDVKVAGDRLLVAGPDHGTGPDTAAGFEVYDVSTPGDPSPIAGLATDHAIHNGFIDGETLYLSGTGAPTEPLVIYDVGGDDPVEVARWSVEDAKDAWATVAGQFRTCHDVYVQDEIAYLAYWDAGTWLLDVSTPADPRPLSSVGGVNPTALPSESDGGPTPGVQELPGNSHYVQPSPDGEVLAVGKEAFNSDETVLDGGPGGIEVWDIADRTAPELLTIIAPPDPGETSHNFGWRGRHLYTSWYGGGVLVYDLSDPAAPRRLAGWADDTTAFWTAKPTRGAIVASSFLDPEVADRDDRFDGVGATLYTFPDPGGDQSEPVETLTQRPTPTVTPTKTPMPVTSTTTRETPIPTTTATPSTSTANSPPSTPQSATDQPSSTTTEGSGNGFGVSAGLTGAGLAAWRLLRARERD